MGESSNTMTALPLTSWVKDARERTFELVEDLSNEQLLGMQLAIVNPLLWEIGHVTWFQEKWVLRHLFSESPGRPDVDRLYDSAAIPHDTRWDLALPSREETLAYMRGVRDRVIERIEHGPLFEQTGSGPLWDVLAYFVQLSVFHEDMHTEAFTYTRQTLQYPAPPLGTTRHSPPARRDSEALTTHQCGPLPGDVEVAGGTCWLGATRSEERRVGKECRL